MHHSWENLGILSPLAIVRLDIVLHGFLSPLDFVPLGFCPPWILSHLDIVPLGFCPHWILSPWVFVLLGFCPLGYCPMGFCPVGFCPRTSTSSSFRSLNMAARRIKLHTRDISNASGQFLLTLTIDILIYVKSIGHCLSPQKISLLCVLYLQRYGVLEIVENKTAANFTQNVTHAIGLPCTVKWPYLKTYVDHSAQTLDLCINMAIEPLVKNPAKSETEEHGPHKILGDMTWNDLDAKCHFPRFHPILIILNSTSPNGLFWQTLDKVTTGCSHFKKLLTLHL